MHWLYLRLYLYKPPTLHSPMKKTPLFLALAISVSSAAALAQAPAATKGDAKAGKQKAVAICSGCHGVPGTKTAFPEVYHVPRIGNQSEAYLVAALRAYRSGERYNPTMKALATALTEKEVLDIAAYYANPEIGKVMK
jgi:cytochrome c553